MTMVTSSQLSFAVFTVHDSKWLLLPLPGPLRRLAVVPSTSTSVKEANWLRDPCKITRRKHFQFSVERSKFLSAKSDSCLQLLSAILYHFEQGFR